MEQKGQPKIGKFYQLSRYTSSPFNPQATKYMIPPHFNKGCNELENCILSVLPIYQFYASPNFTIHKWYKIEYAHLHSLQNLKMVQNYKNTPNPEDIALMNRFRVISNDDNTVSKSSQNTLPWVLPDKYITDWHAIQFILSLPVIFSFSSLLRIVHCLKGSFTGDKQFTNEQISNVDSLHKSKIPVLSISSLLPNLARLQTEKFLVLPTKSWNDTNTFHKLTISPWWRDQSYSSANYMHCSINLSVNVHNFTTIHIHKKFFCLSGWT